MTVEVTAFSITSITGQANCTTTLSSSPGNGVVAHLWRAGQKPLPIMALEQTLLPKELCFGMTGALLVGPKVVHKDSTKDSV